MSTATIDTTTLEASLSGLGADQLAHLAGVLYARATERRKCITVDQARDAIAAAPLTETWERSILSDVGRVRIATRLLIDQGLHPEQVVDGMAIAAAEVIGHPAIEREAIASGLADGMESRERGARD